MSVPNSFSCRTQRRSQAKRAQRKHSFSRSWRRRIPAALLLSLVPLGVTHSAHAQTYTLNDGSNHVSYSLGSDTPGNGGSYGFLYGTSGTTDILDSTSLVHGPFGYIGDGGATEIINQGVIASDVNGGAIHMRSSPFGNTGTIQAINGGTLYLESNLDNTGGTLNVDAASTFNVGATVTGGQSTGAGVLSLNGATLSGFTAGTGLSLSGGNTITDGLTLNGTANVTGGDLHLTDSAVTTTGKGDISLGSGTPANGGSYAILHSDGSTGNTIGAGVTVHGPFGYIGDDGVTLTNQGLISSDVSGGQIVLRDTTFDNDATIEAIGGGAIVLQSAVNNGTNGVFHVDAASTFNVGTTVTGGQSTGAGVLSLNGATLSGFTAGTGLSLSGGNTITDGLTLNGTANVTGGDLHLTDSAVTTTGKGDISLGSGTPANGGSYAILHSDGSTGNTIGAGVTVHGPNGYIGDGGVTLTNQGTIASDVSGGQLTLRDTAFDNDSTIEAIGGGTINEDANVDNTGGGKFVVDAASTFSLGGVTVTGGQSTGAGVITSNSGAILSGFTANTGLSIGNTTITNGLVLNNTANVTGDLHLTDSTVSTTSKGDISLGTSTPASGNGYAILYSDGSTGNTIGAGVTVHGPNGYIGDGGVTLTNQGTIASDVSGGQLTLRDTAFDNDSTIEAIGGGTINEDANVDNTGGGKFVVDAASTFSLGGVTVTGGQSTGAGVITSNSGAILSGFTANTGLSIGNTTITNGLVLNNTANVTGDLHLTDSTVSTTSKGDISLGTSTPANGDNYAFLISQGSTGNTIGAGVTVHGPNGYIGDGGVTLTNQGTIASDVSGGQIVLRDTQIVNQGTVEAVNGGTLIVQTGVTDTGTVQAGAGSTVSFDRDLTQSGGSSQTIADGAISINSGSGTLTVTGGSVAGDGTIQGNVASTGGTVKPGDGTGTLSVTGNYSQDSTSALAIGYTASADPAFTPSNGLLNVAGAVTLAGTLDVAFLGPQLANGQTLATTGEPGTTFDFLTFGTLTNTDFGTLFSNEYMVGSNYFINGIAADNTAAGPAVYQLTESGNALYLNLQTAAAPEPSQWAAFGFGVLGLAGLGWRARRKAAAAS